MFGFIFKNKRLNENAHELYSAVISQSREIVFYEKFLVEDSLDGRFDLMALHMALLLDKFDKNDNLRDVPKMKRILQEIMFDNLDLTLREIGVGDLGVGKKIKVMAEAFYGRMMIYQELLSKNDETEMVEAIKRNLYRGKQIDENIVMGMVSYMFAQYENTKAQEIETIMNGDVVFLVPEETE
ncbi:MAG: ubiquinol-cytochrome C chaperone family protein [Emcibacteraceae bacterium]|nr:ubiquinol-cytochrome C chaperone family protein [Emcibacteraceae bacterium]